MSLFNHVRTRQITTKSLKEPLVTEIKTRRIPNLLKQREISLGRTDKVFASRWLDDKKVVCGTKSNELLVLDMFSDWILSIPVLEGSPGGEVPEFNCGIHSIEISPPKTLLATSGQNPNHLAVYRLPTFDPVCVGEGHTDWVFSVEWIDDFHLATGSRDGSIALWCIQDPASQSGDRSQLKLIIKHPASKLQSTLPHLFGKDKIRDIVYDRNSQTLISLSSRGYVHLWDMNNCQVRSTYSLKYPMETVCLALERDNNLFAVGSQSHVSFYDPRSGTAVGYIGSRDPGAGVRSLSFRDLLLTVGTGCGSLFFFDMRAYKFLRNAESTMICFKSGKGWLREEFQDPLDDYVLEHALVCRSNAVYTHCYDPTGTKLFAAGGPLSLVYYGNYAALWE
ncbi:DDB1- and CUL4-associated factor 12-like [Pocillopora verrucosa]|uniref:DDB1- and CUL4-associated factor 12-like n=1 Tax=Pocillopora verrucosa TaxID=203993 RepID=UPI002797BF56|nr:DDB1- and CUL4-associated factor 12-like [Pocillopora verrucosa]